MSVFELYLKRQSKQFDRYLGGFFDDGGHPDMARYLYGPLKSFSDNAGKRHRPIICLLACEAVGGDRDGLAVGGRHRALPHRRADPRRHRGQLAHAPRRPCMHVTEGEGLAINAGDLALSLVCGTVVNDDGLDDATKLRVLAELVDMTTRTIEGQALDIGGRVTAASTSASMTTS